ncbi:MAG: tRNA lysidine(34) synthetase TilS [Bacteroidales bacterium]|nr:tRNA lysidine(34) synthetase TilS [Bacteroidales bacterium]
MDNLITRVRQFVEEKRLFTYQHKLLLAISGGLDSMVLWEIIKILNIKYAIAHCNFQLRGTESDADEKFITLKAKNEGIPYFIQRFDTEKYAKERNLNIQEAARELRYKYFFDVCSKEEYDYIVTAHHLDDRIETFFINLLRGTGIKGLCSIPVKNDRIIRPLLFCTREELQFFAFQHQLIWREDSSNKEDKYFRNKIRHYLIPMLRELKPSFYHVFNDNFSRLELEKQILEDVINKELSIFIREENKIIHIKKTAILSNVSLHNVIKYYLKQFRFHDKQIDLLLHAELQTGRTIQNKNFTLINDREEWIIKSNEIKQFSKSPFFIHEDMHFVFYGYGFNIRSVLYQDFSEIPKSNFIACLDKGKLQFPLTLRRWKNGDNMIPLGMKNRKKISDILTDAKIPTYKRKDYYVLESNGEVAWLVGLRISEKFKITAETREVYVIEITHDDRVDDHRHDYTLC